MGSKTHDTGSVRPAQLECEIHLDHPEHVDEVRRNLANGSMPLLVEFCARGSRFTLCFVPPACYLRFGRPDAGADYYVLVGLWTMGSHGGFYAFDLGGYITAGYVMEKLRVQNETDAANIAVFLMALGHGHCATDFLTTTVKLYPGRDYLDDRTPEEK
jgi:hypothetical protein